MEDYYEEDLLYIAINRFELSTYNLTQGLLLIFLVEYCSKLINIVPIDLEKHVNKYLKYKCVYIQKNTNNYLLFNRDNIN